MEQMHDYTASLLNTVLADTALRCEEVLSAAGDWSEVPADDIARCRALCVDGYGEKFILRLFGERDSKELEFIFCHLYRPEWPLPRLLASGWYGSRFFTAEAFFPGRTLAEHEALEESRPGQILSLMKKICLAVDALHRSSLPLVHADLSPRNIMLGRGTPESVCLIDPESMHVVGRQTRAKRGTEGYVSPEMTNGKPLTPASDVFSLGAILEEWVQGSEWYRDPNRRSAAALRKVIRNCQAAQEHRYANAGQLAQALIDVEILRLLEAGLLRLRDGNLHLYSRDTGGRAELERCRDFTDGEPIHGVLRAAGRRDALVFTGTALYAVKEPLVRLKPLERLRSRPEPIRFARVILARADGPRHVAVISATETDGIRRWNLTRLHTCGADPETLAELLGRIIRCRVCAFSQEDLQQFYAAQCAAANQALPDVPADKQSMYWDIIAALGEQAAGTCDAILGGILFNRAEQARNRRTARAGDYLPLYEKSAACGNENARLVLEQLRAKGTLPEKAETGPENA